MSWLNISGNLTSLASNVSSFTKEVLTEAGRADEEGTADDSGTNSAEAFNPAVRDELLFLRTEVHSKDEYIQNLLAENEKLRDDHEKHSKNLKQHLLEKEVEIEEFVEKLDKSETEYKKELAKLSREKSQLEADLVEKMSNQDNDTDSDWGNDWGTTSGMSAENEEEISGLKSENESLSNEISMKEIILSSIESKMRQLSGKHLDASEFSTWIDEYISEKLREKDQVENLTELVMYLKDEMNDGNDMNNSDNEEFDMDNFLSWYNKKKWERVELEHKIKKLENTIRSVEDSISQYQKGKEFKIADLDAWLENLSSTAENRAQSPIPPLSQSPIPIESASENNEIIKNRELLMRIQNEIREFEDGDDDDFKIEQFHIWLEKVQTRIDDLEIELLNEQEQQADREKQRSEERAQLKKMFEEKENEISTLKVTLYNASLNPSQENGLGSNAVTPDNSDLNQQLTLLQEQLNEALARSEALQDELSATKVQEAQLVQNHQQELAASQNENNRMNEQLSVTQQSVESLTREKQNLEENITQQEQDLVETRRELEHVKNALNEKNNTSQVAPENDNNQVELERLQREIQEVLESRDAMVTDICTDIKSMENVMLDVINGEHVVCSEDLLETNKTRSEKTASLLKAVVGVAEHSSYLQQEIKKLSDEKHTLENQQKEQEEMIAQEESTLMETQQLLQYVLTMLSKTFPPEILPHSFPIVDDSEIVETAIYESNMVACDAYVKRLSEENKQLKDQTECEKNEMEELNKKIQILQLENASQNTIQHQEQQFQDNLDGLQQTYSHENTGDLGQQLHTLKKQLENSTQEKENLLSRLSDLQSNQTGDQQDQQYDEMTQLKIRDLEYVNASVMEENTRLKNETTTLMEQLSISQKQLSDSEEIEKGSNSTADLQHQIQQLTQQISELSTFSQQQQCEVQQLTEANMQYSNSQQELQNHINTVTEQLQQYQVYSQQMQTENEHLKRLNTAAMTEGPDQEVALKTELMNQVSVLTQENQHYQTEYEKLRQGWIKYQEESNTYIESIQRQFQQLQEQQNIQQQLTQQEQQQSSAAGNNDSTASDVPSTFNSQQTQEKMHNLSILLTEKADECVQLQKEYDELKAKLVELENDASDMELIREECKQLKTMLMTKDQESGANSTITLLQDECKQLKNMLNSKQTELDQMQQQSIEKDNDLSDMDLLREECKQLKLMLVNKESPSHVTELENEKSRLESMMREKEFEYRQLNDRFIDMQNSVSDMELLQEECKQLKQMLLNQNQQQPLPQNDSFNNGQLEQRLLEKEEEIRRKDLVITEMQNTSTDVESLREQCEQLKSMLSERDNESLLMMQNNTSGGIGTENSFLIQVQQLEEMMKEKDDLIVQKDEVITQKDDVIKQKNDTIAEKDAELRRVESRLVELENNTSDMELLHNECRALKDMISDKERVFEELQNDLDMANDMILNKTSDTETLMGRIKKMENEFELQGREVESLRSEVSEAAMQDENIHLLQTEYRKVEESLMSTEQELTETKQKLFDAETHIERLQVYEEQFLDLKSTLKEKEEELTALKLQSSESSILESKTVTLLQEELNQLKTLLYEREEEVKQLNEELDKKNHELKCFSTNVNQAEEKVVEKDQLQMQPDQQFAELQNEIQRLLGESQEKDAIIQELGMREVNLYHEMERLSYELHAMKETANTNDSVQQMFNEIKGKNEELTITNEALSRELTDQKSMNEDLQQKVHQLNVLKQRVEDEKMETEQINQQYANNIKDLQTTITSLQAQLEQTEKNQQNILASVQSNADDVIQSREQLQKQMQIFEALTRNLKSLLQISISEGESSSGDALAELSEIVQKVQWLINDAERKDSVIERTQEDAKQAREKFYANATEKTELLHQKETIIRNLEKSVSQLQEFESLYLEKCKECDELRSTSTESTQQQTAVSCVECEHFRTELAKNSHTLLDKNKECDQLKLDMIQYEEKMYNLQQTLAQMQTVQTQLSEMEQLRNLCHSKDAELQNLQSRLEDSYAMLEGGKKEKAFLDQLMKEKSSLENEKQELVFQNQQMSTQLSELEVTIKHKEVNEKEIESKTKRELERLRNHLMMIEDNHTRDILESQNREEKLQQELDEVKNNLGKKSMILQDSSKQFQDHVGSLEEQLHQLASQRDSTILELEKCREKIDNDGMAMFNLQNALEQLQSEKDEQYEYLVTVSKRKEEEYEERLGQLQNDCDLAQNAMSEASLAVQGINKLNLELEQKDREIAHNKEKLTELATLLEERESQCKQMVQASDTKMEKSLIRNLLVKYFQSPEDKRSDIVKVIGGLLDMPPQQIANFGTGAAPSRVGGWISNVWGYANPMKNAPPSPGPSKTVDTNQSFSELFVKFLETESTQKKQVDSSASLTNADITPASLVLSPTTPDILAFHNNKPEEKTAIANPTIPAPGQEIPRVHTNHAQSTLKDILS